MANIKLGITADALKTVTETASGPRTPFPANPAGYSKYTAVASDIQIKESKDGSKAWLWVQVTNGIYQDSILIGLDPSDISPNTRPENVAKAVQRNLDTLLRAIKVFDIANADGTGIDTEKFNAAKGTLVSFGVKRGDIQDNGYYKYYTTFYGKADSLIPIEDTAFRSTSATPAGEKDMDIPF